MPRYCIVLYCIAVSSYAFIRIFLGTPKELSHFNNQTIPRGKGMKSYEWHRKRDQKELKKIAKKLTLLQQHVALPSLHVPTLVFYLCGSARSINTNPILLIHIYTLLSHLLLKNNTHTIKSNLCFPFFFLLSGSYLQRLVCQNLEILL